VFGNEKAKRGLKACVCAVILFPLCTIADNQEVPGMLSTEPSKSQPVKKSNVTAVYGISADDYLPSARMEDARNELRPKVRTSRSRPALDLPDAFYYAGAPVFMLLFLRVLVIFFNMFEEMRKEEQRKIAAETVPESD
jgi:hypothetical protein